jgi:hypothetical protein
MMTIGRKKWDHRTLIEFQSEDVSLKRAGEMGWK